MYKTIKDILCHFVSKKALEYRAGTIIITIGWVLYFSFKWGHGTEGLLCSGLIIFTKFFWYGIHEYRHGTHQCPACRHEFR